MAAAAAQLLPTDNGRPPAGSSALDPAERLVRKRDHSELFSKHILSPKTSSMKSKIFSCGSVNTIWQPISFPNIAEHGHILTKCGAQSVSRLLLNMGKYLQNTEAYHFPQILLNMDKSLLNVEPNQFPDYF